MLLQTELKTLFDDRIIRKASQFNQLKSMPWQSTEAAGALLRLKGQLEQQMGLVKTMHPATTAALYRWLADSAFWGIVSGIVRH